MAEKLLLAVILTVLLSWSLQSEAPASLANSVSAQPMRIAFGITFKLPTGDREESHD